MLLQCYCKGPSLKTYSNMKVSFTPELNHRANSKGEHSIQIRCSQNRIHRRINTEISVPKKSWDSGKQEVKKTHPLAQQYNRIIRNWLLKISKGYSELLETGEDIDLDHLLSTFCTRISLIRAPIFFSKAFSSISYQNR